MAGNSVAACSGGRSVEGTYFETAGWATRLRQFYFFGGANTGLERAVSALAYTRRCVLPERGSVVKRFSRFSSYLYIVEGRKLHAEARSFVLNVSGIPNQLLHPGFHRRAEVHRSCAATVRREDGVFQVVETVAACADDRDDRHAKARRESPGIDHQALTLGDIAHVQHQDQRHGEFEQLGGEVEVAREIAGIDDVHHHVRTPVKQEIPRDQLFLAQRRETVDPRQVDQPQVGLGGVPEPLLPLDGDTRVVAHTLPRARETVEDRGLAGVRVTGEGDGEGAGREGFLARQNTPPKKKDPTQSTSICMAIPRPSTMRFPPTDTTHGPPPPLRSTSTSAPGISPRAQSLPRNPWPPRIARNVALAPVCINASGIGSGLLRGDGKSAPLGVPSARVPGVGGLERHQIPQARQHLAGDRVLEAARVGLGELGRDAQNLDQELAYGTVAMDDVGGLPPALLRQGHQVVGSVVHEALLGQGTQRLGHGRVVDAQAFHDILRPGRMFAFHDVEDGLEVVFLARAQVRHRHLSTPL